MGEPSNEPEKAPIALQVDAAWKIYGPEKDVRKLLQSENRHAPKSEILEKTGCVLGLRNISFEVRKGEFFVLMGLSGSGKSTLVRCLNRLVNPTQGRILVGDEDICTFNRDQLIEFRRHTISMVFQHFGLLPHYTVLDNVAYGLKIRGMGKEERHACAQAAIETVGLKGWEDYLPASLSGGMQQRVGMARA
ncbi:MAG: ATP-binding cassette domain-containing protein, partial [Desulfuromonadales bacterium]|nr:ATP-binding cassette domain-containing protein [Desulfuromonadales bacterium]